MALMKASPQTHRLRWQPQLQALGWWRALPLSALGTAAALLTLVIGMLLAYRQPMEIVIQVGRSTSWPFVEGFFAAEKDDARGLRWRWSEAAATIGAPYAGRVSSLTLRFNGEQNGPPLTVQAAGGPPLVLPSRVGWQTLALPITDGRLHWERIASPLIRLETTARQRSVEDTRPLGVAVAEARLQVLPGPPPPALVALLLATLVLSMGLLAVLRVPLPWLFGCLIAVLLSLLLASPFWRLYLTAYAGRLVWVLLLAGGLYGGLRWGLPRLWQVLGVRVSLPTTRLLIGLVLLHFVLRFGALSYPLTYSSDLYGHVKRANIAASGQLLRLFLPEPERAPVQWGVSVAVPYSPFYYYVGGLLVRLFPFFPPILVIDAFSALVEAATPLLLAILLLCYGLGARAAVWTTALYGLVPFGYLATVGWALFPTMLGQSLALGALALAATWFPERPSRRVLRWQIVLLTLAFVAYLTALTFLAQAWVVLLLISMFWYRQAVRPLLITGLAAGLGALILYYGWQAPALIGQALPALEAKAGGEGVGMARGMIGPLAFGEFLWERLEKWFPWLLTLPALLGLALLTVRPRRRVLLALVVAWCSIYPPFMLLDRFLPLLDKPQFHMLPALALLAGIGAAGLARRGRVARLVPLSLALLLGWQLYGLIVQVVIWNYGNLKF